MEIFKVLIINLALVSIFAISLAAQSIPVADSKARLINTQAFFDEKTGIKDFIEVYRRLKEEFKFQEQELKVMSDETKKLKKELDEISKIREPRFSYKEFLNDKITGYESAIYKLKTKQEEAKSLFDEREESLTVKINKKIVIALKQFAKENDYSAIGDVSKLILWENGISISINDSLDVTKEFIQFYNERFAVKKQQ